jgi:putative FmdB family regulatory protein
MPIYEYECKSCHHRFDLMQKITDVPTKQCPKCFQEAAVRLISAAGFHLKGTGWYATDYKNKDKKSTQSTETDTTGPEKKPADAPPPPPAKTEKKGDKD